MGVHESVSPCSVVFVGDCGIFSISAFVFNRFLGKRGVKEEIIDFDPRTITAENREGVEKLLKKNGDSFEPEVGY
jgi:dynein heavy chain 2